MTLQHKRFTIILLTIPFILLIPLIAMQFTSQVNWTSFDFLMMGILLSVVGLASEMILRKVTKRSHRIVLLLSLILVFFLIWAELAVGLFGTPFAGT